MVCLASITHQALNSPQQLDFMHNHETYLLQATTEPQAALSYLIFTSSAVSELNDQQLAALCQQSARNNQRRCITGHLIYDDGNFLSVLEGHPQKVQILFQTISKDSRHHGLIVIDEGLIAQRKFSNWSMRFQKHQHEAGRRIMSAMSSMIDLYSH